MVMFEGFEEGGRQTGIVFEMGKNESHYQIKGFTPTVQRKVGGEKCGGGDRRARKGGGRQKEKQRQQTDHVGGDACKEPSLTFSEVQRKGDHKEKRAIKKKSEKTGKPL